MVKWLKLMETGLGRRPTSVARLRVHITRLKVVLFATTPLSLCNDHTHLRAASSCSLLLFRWSSAARLTPRETELITRLHLPAASEVAAQKVHSRVRHFGRVSHCGGPRRYELQSFKALQQPSCAATFCMSVHSSEDGALSSFPIPS